MKTLFCFLAAVLTCAQLQAQTAAQPIVALVQKSGPAAAKKLPAVDSAKYNRALRVYERLVKAGGKTRVAAPKFVMTMDARYMVWMNPKTPEIGLEGKAFDVAATYGKDADAALALLLGRALTQFYEKSDSLRVVPPGKQSNVADEESINYLGGFLAYSAGYGVFEKGPELLAALYKAYQLPALVKGYPTLEDRKKRSKSAVEKLRRLTEVSEVGNLLAALGKYEDAYAYFQFQLQEYQSREICNNAGVVAILGALNYFRPAEPEVKFRYPVELDLYSSSGRGDKDFRDLRTRMLHDAIGHFDAAIRLSPEYAPAYLNKACAYALLGDAGQAQSFAADAQQKAGKPGNEKTATDVQILLGILHAQKGDTEKASAAFKVAAGEGSALAEHNLNVLQGKETPVPTPTSGFMMRKETIDALDLADPYNLPEPVPESEIVLNPQLRLYHNLNPGPNSRYYLSDNTALGQQTYFLLTGPDYAGQTAKKLGIGASRTEIEEAYPAPLRVLETPAGQIRVHRGIILILGPDGKLSRWALYGEGG